MKSTVEEIRRRFDADVERFSNLETGQSATVDAPLAMALVAEAAAVTTPQARHVLDVGCGAGNYTLKLLESLPNLDATLIDLSQPMLDRARERVSRATAGRITTLQADIREARLPDGEFDIVLAAAVLHHLRTDREWQEVFTAMAKAFGAPRPVKLPTWLFRLAAPYVASFAADASLQVSNAKAKAELGWSPKYPTYREGIAAAAAGLVSGTTH